MYTYIVRVRGTKYLWGSKNLTVDLNGRLFLVINNDSAGDTVELSAAGSTGTPTPLGSLAPGECWTFPLEGLRGVAATCSTDSTLACSILGFA